MPNTTWRRGVGSVSGSGRCREAGGAVEEGEPTTTSSAAAAEEGRRAPPRWIVLADDDTAFVLPNLLHALRGYDHREPWYLGSRSESAAQNAWHGFAMAYGGAGIAVSWPLARRLARALDSCVLRYPHLYGSDARIYACLAELGVELTHEPGFHQVRPCFFLLLLMPRLQCAVLLCSWHVPLHE